MAPWSFRNNVHPEIISLVVIERRSEVKGMARFRVRLKYGDQYGDKLDPAASVMIDYGRAFGDLVKLQRVKSRKAYDLLFTYDTCRGPNGSRSAMASNDSDVVPDGVYSEPVRFTVANTITSFSRTARSGKRKGEMYCDISARLTVESRWRIDVLRGSGRNALKLKHTTVRSATGIGRDIRWTWDGRDNRGDPVEDRLRRPEWQTREDWSWQPYTPYFYRITVYKNGHVLQQTAPFADPR
jgi:hypothetical protein